MHYKLWGRMRKKLIFGIVLVLTLLLLMPSIPAINHNVVKDGILSEISDDLDFNELKELIDFPDVKHPFLYLFVYSVALFRLIRIIILADLASEPTDYPPYFEITNWFLFIRCLLLSSGRDLWLLMWKDISESYGWGWFD